MSGDGGTARGVPTGRRIHEVNLPRSSAEESCMEAGGGSAGQRGDWWIRFGERVDGPYTQQQLREAVGRVPPGLEVWSGKQWTSLEAALAQVPAQEHAPDLSSSPAPAPAALDAPAPVPAPAPTNTPAQQASCLPGCLAIVVFLMLLGWLLGDGSGGSSWERSYDPSRCGDLVMVFGSTDYPLDERDAAEREFEANCVPPG